jgi:hypothetical protein
MVAVLVFGGITVTFFIQSFVSIKSSEDIARLFSGIVWLGPRWLVCGYTFDAETSLRTRFGLRINERTIRFAESKFWIYFFAVMLSLFLVFAILFALAYFHFAGR